MGLKVLRDEHKWPLLRTSIQILHRRKFVEIARRDSEWKGAAVAIGSNQLKDCCLEINRTVIGQSNDRKCRASAPINYGRGLRAVKYQRRSYNVVLVLLRRRIFLTVL